MIHEYVLQNIVFLLHSVIFLSQLNICCGLGIVLGAEPSKMNKLQVSTLKKHI